MQSNQDSAFWLYRFALVAIAMIALALPVDAEENDQSLFEVGIDVSVERDDNVTMASGIGEGEEIESDIVWHARPELNLGLIRPHQEFGLSFIGDIRRGTDTELDEQNFVGIGDVDLEFEGGWGVRLFDRYVQTEFDQAVFFTASDISAAEAGVAGTRANTIGGEIKIEPRRLFRIDLGYDVTDETVDFDTDQETTSDQRDITNTSVRVTVPLGKAFAVYAAYKEAEQEASERLSRSFEDRSAVVGLNWRPRRGSRFSIEGGRGEVDFFDQAGVEYEHTVALARYEQEAWDNATFQVAAGVDTFGEFVYEGFLEHEIEDLQTTRIRLRRFTQKSFSVAIASPIIDAFLITAQWNRRLKTRWHLDLVANYLTLESPDGGVTQDDSTANAAVRLAYDFGETMRLGAYCQWSERNSITPVNEFEDNRYGMFFRIHN